MASLRVIKGRYYFRVWIKGREKCFPTGTSVLSDAKRQLKKFQGMEVEIKQKIRDDWEHPALGIDKAINMRKNLLKTFRLKSNRYVLIVRNPNSLHPKN